MQNDVTDAIMHCLAHVLGAGCYKCSYDIIHTLMTLITYSYDINHMHATIMLHILLRH